MVPERRYATCCWNSGRLTPTGVITIPTTVSRVRLWTQTSAAGGARVRDFASGVWRFQTIKPGAVVGRDGRMMAPHLNLWVVARGINIGLNTRMYFC